ncbi:isoprenoid synthase domain-containing protein [Mycena floridula]|nr:isoprenoid synthase domain-containing protein [Mycena floridula]
MVQYRIPSLLTILQPYLKPENPNQDALTADYVAWIDAASFLTEKHKEAWKRAELPLLMTRVFPDSDKDHLKVCLEYMMLFLILEQVTDTPATTAEAQQWADIFVHALKQDSEDEAKGLGWVMNHLASRVMGAIDAQYRPYLIASNISLAEGVVKEAADRENPNHELTLEAYMDARRLSIGLRPFFDLGRWTWNLDLPEDVLTAPLVAKLEEITVDMVSLSNDLYSYKKEYFESGAGHNFVTVAMKDPVSSVAAGDRQAAIDYTYKRVVDLLADFDRAKGELPSFGIQSDRKLAEYITRMMDAVVGNIQWSLTCKRYGHSPSPEGEVVFEMDPL